MSNLVLYWEIYQNLQLSKMTKGLFLLQNFEPKGCSLPAMVLYSCVYIKEFEYTKYQVSVYRTTGPLVLIVRCCFCCCFY